MWTPRPGRALPVELRRGSRRRRCSSATSAYFSNAPVGSIFGDIAGKMKIPPIGLVRHADPERAHHAADQRRDQGHLAGHGVQRRARPDQADHRLTATRPGRRLWPARVGGPVLASTRLGREVIMTVVSQTRAGVRRAARADRRAPAQPTARQPDRLRLRRCRSSSCSSRSASTRGSTPRGSRCTTSGSRRTTSQTWVGLDNYRNLFTNQFFWNAFKNTITIGIISTVPQLCLALGIAHLLNYRLRGRTFFRVAMLMPYATSLAAATVIFVELFGPDYGIINWVAAPRCTCRPSTGRARSGRARSRSRRSSPGGGPATTR